MTMLSHIPEVEELELRGFRFVDLDLLKSLHRHPSLSTFTATIPVNILSQVPLHFYEKLSLDFPHCGFLFEDDGEQWDVHANVKPEWLNAIAHGLDIRCISLTASFTEFDSPDNFGALPRNALCHLDSIWVEYDTDKYEDSYIFGFEDWLASTVRRLPSVSTLRIDPINLGDRRDFPLLLLGIYDDDRTFIDFEEYYVSFELTRLDASSVSEETEVDFRQYWKAHWAVSFLCLEYRGDAEEFKELHSFSQSCQTVTCLKVKFQDTIALTV